MRRRGGLIVLLAALLLLAVPALRPGPVDGRAAPETVAGPPAVGDCVTEPVQRYPGYGSRTGGSYLYPQLAVAPCVGIRFAEVVSVLTDPVEPEIVVAGSSVNVSDPNQDACRIAVRDHLGTRVTVDPTRAVWSTVTTVEVSVTRPSPRQEAAGQRWLACLAAARGVTHPDQDPAPYDGTLRNAISTGVARDRIGACTTDDDLGTASYPTGGCNRPHTVQLLATTRDFPAGSPVATAEAGCRSTAERLTGLPDVTAGGALTVVIAVTVDGLSMSGDVVPVDALVSCGIRTTGGRTLDGGLVGLGDRPLPWT